MSFFFFYTQGAGPPSTGTQIVFKTASGWEIATLYQKTAAGWVPCTPYYKGASSWE